MPEHDPAQPEPAGLRAPNAQPLSAASASGAAPCPRQPGATQYPVSPASARFQSRSMIEPANPESSAGHTA